MRVGFLSVVVAIAVVSCAAEHAVAQEQPIPAVAPPAVAPEEEAGRGQAHKSQRTGVYMWWSPASTGRGRYQRIRFKSKYAHSSVTTPIEPGIGTFFRFLSILPVGLGLEGGGIYLRFDAAILGLLEFSAPGHRKPQSFISLIDPYVVVGVRPSRALPLRLEVEAEYSVGSIAHDSQDGGKSIKESGGDFEATFVSSHVTWEVYKEYFMGHPLFEAGLGGLWYAATGNIGPDETYPGVEFEGGGMLLGGRLGFAVPIRWDGNFFCPWKKSSGLNCGGHGLFLQGGYYVGMDGEYMASWQAEWRFGL